MSNLWENVLTSLWYFIYPNLDLRNSTSLNVEERWKMSIIILKMVSSNFLFVVFSFNVLFLLNFLLPHTEALWISWTLSKTHFWNLKLLVKLLFFAHFLIFLCSLCSIELQIFQIFAPVRTPNFIHSYFTFFVFIFCFISHYIVIYNYFHNFQFIL